MIKRLIKFVRYLAPGSYVMSLFLLWLVPIVLISLVVSAYCIFETGFEYIRQERIFMIRFSLPIITILVLALIASVGLNLVERECNVWKRIGEWGQFFYVIGAYTLVSIFGYTLIITYPNAFGYMDDANMAGLLYPSLGLYAILGFLMTCLRIFIITWKHHKIR